MMNQEDSHGTQAIGGVAWQKTERGAWSKVHRTADNGRTTLCGMTVPESFNTDSWSQMGACKQCLASKATA